MHMHEMHIPAEGFTPFDRLTNVFYRSLFQLITTDKAFFCICRRCSRLSVNSNCVRHDEQAQRK